MAVHHIHMDAVCSSAFRFGHLVAQMGEISREDRRSEHHYLGRHDAPFSLR
jgi:hypothetical protein